MFLIISKNKLSLYMNFNRVLLYMKYYDIEKEYCIKWLHCIKKVIKTHEPLYNLKVSNF